MEYPSKIAETISFNTNRNQQSRYRSWSDLEHGILLKIFMSLSILDLMGSVSCVCTTWRSVCRDPRLWERVNLTLLLPKPFISPNEAKSLDDKKQGKNLMKFLQTSLSLSRGNISCLIFSFYFSITNAHLNYVSERTLELKRLVLPPWTRVGLITFRRCIKRWKELVSMTMPICYFDTRILKWIGAHCKNFSELKLVSPFMMDYATTIVEHVPNLKVLSLQGCLVEKEALVYILNNLEKLEVLNLCHCIIQDAKLPEPGYDYVQHALDESIVKGTLRLKVFLYCKSDCCHVCYFMYINQGRSRWSDSEIWQKDMVNSLAAN